MSNFLRRCTRLGALVAALLGSASVVHAQGVITGVVTDQNTGTAITGASIRIGTIGREAITDRTGRYSFTGIPAGSYELMTRYIGFAPVTERVTVENGRTVVANLKLVSATNTLGAMVVQATRSGQAAALNQQKNSANVTNVVAADQIGRFPDANLGDALKRIPGVTIALDQGEARFGSIRGTEPRFNSVMVNGERVPSAEADVRQVQLDLIPADMVQAVEVNKTLTPDARRPVGLALLHHGWWWLQPDPRRDGPGGLGGRRQPLLRRQARRHRERVVLRPAVRLRQQGRHLGFRRRQRLHERVRHPSLRRAPHPSLDLRVVRLEVRR
jgi:hypothetical protein